VRIVFVTHAYAPAIGGAERYAQGLAEAMAETGHDVYVLTPNKNSAEAFYEYGHRPLTQSEETISGVQIRRIDLEPSVRWWKPTPNRGPIPVEASHAMWDAYARVIAVEIERLQPDATIALPHAFPNVHAALEAPSRGVTVYAPLLHEGDPAWRVEPIANLVAKSNVVLSMTEWERERLIRAYGSRPDLTVVAPPVVDAPSVDTVVPHELEMPFVVAIGRRTDSKNLLATARVVRDLNTGGTRVRLIIAGPGSDPELDRELQRSKPDVDVIGEVSEEEKWSLIKGCAAYVSMSTAESFGIGITEAWAMRRPAISRRVASISSIVDDGIDGFLVDDEDELEVRLRTLLADPDRASRMGAAGRLKVQYSRRSIASTVLTAITDALRDGYNLPVNGGTPFDGS
jgi:glycosyltransferase involved in cell wall biosynthesis